MTFIPISPLQERARFLLSKTVTTGLAVGEAVSQLVRSIGWPLMRVRPLQPDDLPYRDDYIAMATEAQQDVTTAYNLLPRIAEQGLLVANYNEAGRSDTLEQCSRVEGLVAQLEDQRYVEARTLTIGIGARPVAAQTRGQVYTETFSTTEHLDTEATSGVALDPNGQCLTLKAASVQHITTALPYIGVVRGHQVVGLPGTTMEVRAPQRQTLTAEQTPTVSFVGEQGAHADTTALFDGDASTWFEFERCDIAWKQPLQKVGQAYITDSAGVVTDVHKAIAPDDWTVQMVSMSGGDTETFTFTKPGPPIDDGVLRLGIGLPFTQPTLCTSITITPYIPENGIACRVSTIFVVDENEKTIALNQAPWTFDTTKVIPLPNATRVRYIYLLFEQPAAYETLIGHAFLVASIDVKSSKKFLGISYNKKSHTMYRRLATPKEQYKYNTTHTSTLDIMKATVSTALGIGLAAKALPLAGIGSGALGATNLLTTFGGAATGGALLLSIAAAGWIAGTLFGSKTSYSVKEVSRGVDVLAGQRWQIGLRGIDVTQTTYNTAGTFTSTAYTFARTLQAVCLKAAANQPAQTNIVYSISVDNGTTWLPIKGDGTPVMVSGGTTVQLKAAFTGTTTTSPILYGYTLQGYTL